MLLSGVGDAAGGKLAQPTHPHTDQYLHPDRHIDSTSSNRYAAAAYRDRDGNRHDDSFFHPIADLHTLFDAHDHADFDIDEHAGAADQYLYAYDHAHACTADPDGYSDPRVVAGQSIIDPLYSRSH